MAQDIGLQGGLVQGVDELHGLDQAIPGDEIEVGGEAAKLKIEIHQQDAFGKPRLVGHGHGDVGGDEAGATATLGVHEGDELRATDPAALAFFLHHAQQGGGAFIHVQGHGKDIPHADPHGGAQALHVIGLGDDEEGRSRGGDPFDQLPDPLPPGLVHGKENGVRNGTDIFRQQHLPRL